MLETVCCDEVRTSKHCPECGKKLEHPLSALYRHLDGVVKIDDAKLQTVKKDTKFKNENAVLYKRRVARVEKTLAKWVTWRNAVRDVIMEAGGPCETEMVLPPVGGTPPMPPVKKPKEEPKAEKP